MDKTEFNAFAKEYDQQGRNLKFLHPRYHGIDTAESKGELYPHAVGVSQGK